MSEVQVGVAPTYDRFADDRVHFFATGPRINPLYQSPASRRDSKLLLTRQLILLNRDLLGLSLLCFLEGNSQHPIPKLGFWLSR